MYIFHEKIAAFGGFPVGSAGKLVSLISGGIDSPVATFLMMKRGVLPVLLHFQVSEEEAAKMWIDRNAEDFAKAMDSAS